MIFLKVLLLLHVLGDFYFQTNKINQLKKEKTLFLVVHALIYAILFIPLFWMNTNYVLISIIIPIIFMTHFLCDYFISKLNNGVKTKNIFLIDQLIHVLSLVIVAYLLKDTFIETTYINNHLTNYGILTSIEKIISILLIFLIIGRPTSIIIEMCLPIEVADKTEKIEEGKQENASNFNYGSLIGVLERAIIVLLAVLNLWSSIALVFTAKSIARFKQLDDENFAKKYLIGTLLSLSITLLILLLIL